MSLNDEQKLAAEKSLRPNANNEIDYFALGDSFAHIRPISSFVRWLAKSASALR
jgi:hypothetical protein